VQTWLHQKGDGVDVVEAVLVILSVPVDMSDVRRPVAAPARGTAAAATLTTEAMAWLSAVRVACCRLYFLPDETF